MKEFGFGVESLDPLYQCCDLCEQRCDCQKCQPFVGLTSDELDSFAEVAISGLQIIPWYTCQTVDSNGIPISLLFCKEVVSSLPDIVIDAI